MKNTILSLLLLAVIFLSATNPTWLSQRSSVQLVQTFSGSYAMDNAKNFISKEFKEGYKVIAVSSLGVHDTYYNEVIVVMEK